MWTFPFLRLGKIKTEQTEQTNIAAISQRGPFFFFFNRHQMKSFILKKVQKDLRCHQKLDLYIKNFRIEESTAKKLKHNKEQEKQ